MSEKRSKESVAVYMTLMGMKASGLIEEDAAERLDQIMEEAFTALEQRVKELEMSLDLAQGESSGFRSDVNALKAVIKKTIRFSKIGKAWACLLCQGAWENNTAPMHGRTCPVAALPKHLKEEA